MSHFFFTSHLPPSPIPPFPLRFSATRTIDIDARASIGIDTSTTLGLQSGNSVIALIGEACCIWFIDRLGRRGPFIWGNALSGFTFVIGTIIIATWALRLMFKSFMTTEQ